MKRFLMILMVALALPVSMLAQTAIGVQVPNLVAVDEQFNLTFVIEGENAPSSFDWAGSDDFQLVWGPQKGSSTSISIINGKKTKSSQVTYTYVLMPKKSGSFQLPAAEAVVKGNKIHSSPKTIEVVSNSASGSSSRPQTSSSSSSSQSASSFSDVSTDNLFMKLTLSKSRVVVGEQLTAVLKLYQNVNVARFEDAKFPAFGGFWSQELQAPSNIEFQREKVGDRIYNSAVLRSWTLIPQQSGEITIEPAELVCLVNVRNQSASSGSIFDSFFQDDYRTVRKKVVTPEVKVRVSALPAGAPDSFGGGVGSFRMTAELNRDSLRTHDAGSLRITLTGKGNITLLEAPKVNFPPDFEVYDVKTVDGNGTKTFEYPFIPRSYGDFELAPVQYSYYDISAGRYVTLQSAPMTIKVSRGNDTEPGIAAGGQLVQGTLRKDVKDLASDIRFISTKIPSFSRSGSFLIWSPLFWGLMVFLMIAAAVVYAVFRKLSSMRADVAGSKKRAATKMARKRLAKAGEYLDKNLHSAFYEELHRALLGFISDKLGMDAADMSKDNIAETLASNGVSDGLVSDLTGLIDACEFARYAPSSEAGSMKQHYDSALGIISSIDDNMKKKHTSGAAAAVLALLMLMPSVADAAQAYPDSLWKAAAAAYTDGNWQEAGENWSAIASLGIESPELYCNMGNAFFKLGDHAHAILNYERALRLDPSYSDARFNLELANGMVQDRIDAVPQFFLVTWARELCWLMKSDVWAVLGIVLFALALALALMFLLSRSSAGRRAGFFGGIAALVLSLLCIGMASWQKRDYQSADSAIITSPVCSVKSSPGGDAKDLFVLHEGTKVKILDEIGHWCNIEIADGRQGWMESQSAERISMGSI